MTDSDFPTSRPELKSINKIIEQIQQARRPKCQHQYPELRPESDPEQSRFSRPLDDESNLTNAVYFCRICKNFELGSMLAGAQKARSINLNSFNDPNCQLCCTIRHFVNLHWEFEWPVAIKGCQPRVHIDSRIWCSFHDSCSSRKTVYRITLALDQRPPNLNLMRRALDSDATSKFVLTELEIDPATVGDTTDVPSLRRPILPCIDLRLVNGWLKACENHGPCNENRIFQWSNMVPFFEDGFRLIDVEEGRLVEKRKPCNYVALSYVWGRLEPGPLCLCKENLSALSQLSALDPTKDSQSAGDQMSGTVADTITLCRSIGQKYLWVDSLCIIQDDAEERTRLIHGMDRVYENAMLTVIALSGSDATAGLAGIRARRHNRGLQNLFHEVHGTHSIAIGRISLMEQIQSSHWNTRGWTFQEQVLSSRKLYFSCDEVFYECPYDTRREGYADDNNKKVLLRPPAPWYGRDANIEFMAYTDLGLPSLLRKLPDTYHDHHFQNIVSSYTRKSLTEPGDILNALTGIYHKYYRGSQDPGINAFQAIPMRLFFESLLWFTGSHNCERRSIANGFKPSTWSWISWVAPIDFACAGGTTFSEQFKWEHFDLEIDLLIDKCFLSFQEDNTVKKFTFPCPPQRCTMGDFEGRIKLDELLEAFSKGNYEGAVPPKFLTPGVLEFEGPYIPTPTAACSRWVEGANGEWDLEFETRRSRIRRFIVVKLDPGEDKTDGFVILLYNFHCLGLCVKKAGGYFERVGLVGLDFSGATWRTLADDGLIELQWKRILLR